MSISVKSISVSIDGTQSNKYIINLSGGTFVMSNFCMIERLMNHCTLSFSLVKDPLESITDAQMQVCADIIGKEVELHLQTDPMENELPGYSGDSVADIEFKGFIQSARATRTTSAQYAIKVDALSYDGVLDDHPDYRTFEQMMEKDIIEDQLQAAPKVEFDVAPLLDLEGNPLLYSAKWNETTWGFIRRMAVRYGEWLFHDGRKLYFGKMPEKDAVRLNYPSRELTGYSIQLETRHVNYSQIRSIEAGDLYDFHDYLSEMGDMLNQHNEAAFNASKELYPYQTMSQFTDEACDGIEWNTNKSKTLNLGQAKGTKASLLTYSGSSCCSKLSVGVKLTVVDNYITDDMSGQKSEVPQEEILITQVTHLFSCDDTYSNTFSGLPGNTERPPYANAAAIPYAMPTRAWVEDNDERYHTACVRVVFPWGKAQEDAGREKVLSPWIRVEQPYTSNVAGCYVIPEIGTEVMVDFEGGNAEMPYVRASNFNGIIGDKTVTLKKGTDYTVSYKNNKKLGSYATVTIKGKGNYSGSVARSFQIVPKGTEITKLTALKKGFKVQWTKQAKNTNGYEIQYCTSKKFAMDVFSERVEKTKTVSKKIQYSNLKSKKTYYVRIRTYKKTSDGYIYSAWSKIKRQGSPHADTAVRTVP